MKFFLFISCFIISLFVHGQLTVDTLFLGSGRDSVIHFPAIATSSDASNKVVKKIISKEVFATHNSKTPIEKIVNEYYADSIAVDYQVGFNQDGLLSLVIHQYTLSGTTIEKHHINIKIDKKTKPLRLKDVFTPQKEVLNKMTIEHIEKLTTYQDSLRMQEDSLSIDSPYSMAIEYIEGCKTSFVLTDFYLTESGVTIVDNCEFPIELVELQPITEMYYSYEELAPYLKIAP